MDEYKILEHIMSFDWMVVTYFFLAGVSAGAYIFSVVANYWMTEFKPLARAGAIVAPIALAIGMFFLFIDLGQPFRAWRLFLTFNPTSAISWGTWFINIFILLNLVYAWFLIKDEDEKAKKWALSGLPFAVLVSTYTAVILAQSPGKELWRHIVAIIPWLFLVGALVSGIALVMLVSAGRKEDAILAKLGKILAGFIFLELGIVFTDVLILMNGGTIAVESAKSFLVGEFSFLFWVVEVILGSFIPVFIFLRKKVSAKGYAVASMLVLVGIFAMRYIVVIGGQAIN